MVREEFIAENTGLLGDTNIQELSEERLSALSYIRLPTPARRR